MQKYKQLQFIWLSVQNSGCSTWRVLDSRLCGYQATRIEVTMFSLVIAVALFLVYLPPEAVSQQCRSGVTDEIRQSVREQLRQGGGNGTIPTVAVNCGQVCSVAKCSWVHVHKGCMDVLQCNVWSGMVHMRVCCWTLCFAYKLFLSKYLCYSIKIPMYVPICSWELSLQLHVTVAGISSWYCYSQLPSA